MKRIITPPLPGERRYDNRGPFECMAYAKGWLLVHRPGMMPHAMHATEWEKLSKVPVSE